MKKSTMACVGMAALLASAGGVHARLLQTTQASAAEGNGGVNASVNAQWPSFRQLDRNSDGYLDHSEMAGVPVLDVGSADADGDRRLNRAEFEAAKRAAPARGGESDMPLGGTAGPDRPGNRR